MSTFKLINALKDCETIEELIINSGGEITPDLEGVLKDIDLTVKESVDKTRITMERMELSADYWKKRAKESQLIGRALMAMHEKFKDQIKRIMVESDKQDLIGVDYRYKIVNKPSKIVVDESELSVEMCMEKITLVPDMEKISALMAKGIKVPGCKYESVIALNCYPNKKEI